MGRPGGDRAVAHWWAAVCLKIQQASGLSQAQTATWLKVSERMWSYYLRATPGKVPAAGKRDEIVKLARKKGWMRLLQPTDLIFDRETLKKKAFDDYLWGNSGQMLIKKRGFDDDWEVVESPYLDNSPEEKKQAVEQAVAANERAREALKALQALNTYPHAARDIPFDVFVEVFKQLAVLRQRLLDHAKFEAYMDKCLGNDIGPGIGGDA